MSQLHIIGVGGTGHKLVSSVIHLAACGAFKGNLGKHTIDAIRVLTIDADDSNGNLLYTKQVMFAYHDYYTAVNGAASLGLIPVEPVSDKINLPLFLAGKDSISKAFNIPQYADSDEDSFIRFLYTDNEIDEDFQHGFYGHTSIGTLIVKDILNESEVWRSYLPTINAGDFVVVIGSIFGGTGASAIPVLLDELSEQKRQTAFNIAALVLNPYFQTVGEIQQEGLLQPDSANFNVKARAALYYYYTQNLYAKTNALYVIGEPQINFSVERSSRGAADQRNKASPIELFAATALIDFIRNSNDRSDSGIIAAQRAVGGGKYLYTWDMLQNVLPDLPKNMQAALKTAVFYNKVIYPELRTSKAAGVYQGYYDNLGSQRDQNQNFIYDNIHRYLNLLVEWFYDVHKCNRNEVNQNTGALMWDPDPRVKLFNAQFRTLFDDVPVSDADIKDFDDIVIGDTNKKKSTDVYNHINKKPPPAGKDFAALLGLMYDFINEEKKGLFSKKPAAPEKFDMTPYLSKENNATFAIPASPNELWAKSQPALLSSIAEGLPTGVSQTFTKNDISIPSPWSIFIMNELTLTESKFAGINKNAYNEWCGIIALLVLRKICRYEKQGLQFEALHITGGDGGFFSVIDKTLTPESYIFSNPNWKQCHRLSLDVEYPLGTKQVTLAFLANNTLVCPAYHFDEAVLNKLNLIAPDIVNEARQFQYPGNYFKDQSQTLNRDAKYVLKQFLTELGAIITREAAQNKRPIIKSLQALVNQFNADLGAVTPNSNLTIDPQKKTAIKTVASLFEELCIAPNQANIDLPFIIEGAKKRAALIGTTICGISSSSSDAASLLITENLMFNHINAVNIAAYNNMEQDGIKLIYADELLLDSMILIKRDGEPVFHVMSNNNSFSADYDIIWPLNALLLELYSAEALNKMVSISGDNEKIMVSLKIKLKCGIHTIKKEYHIKQSSQMSDADKNSNGLCWIMEKNLAPFWSVWPYARINDTSGNNTWQRYTCFCIEIKYRGFPVLDIKPVFEGGGQYLAGERALSTLQHDAMTFFYRRYSTLPSAFIVNEKTEGSPLPRGLVFLAEAKAVNAGAVHWNVGVDFGTTSTTAFYTTSGDSTPRFIQLMTEYEWKEGSDKPEKYAFNNDITKLCDNGDESSEIYFIDKQCFKQNGFATALEIMDTSQMNVDATLFTETRNFWHNFYNFKIMNTQEGRKERLLTNIKWESNKSNSAKYLNQLLTHIVYQAAEKGVRTINFYFSYPTAFGPGAKDEFCDRINGIIKLIFKETGITLNFNENQNLITESIAAAYYFNHKKPRQTVFFCVDIGGGSTDASIWEKTKHIFQTSIHFASRDMFIRPLSRLFGIPSVLNMVTTDVQSDGIYTMLSDVSSGKNLTNDKFKFLIETVLFEFNEPLVNRLQNMQGQDAEAFKIFKYCVFITYSGMVYYLANILAALFMIQDEERKIDNDIGEVILGLSGKGSKLTGWIKSYCTFIYEEAQNLIKEKTSLDITILSEFSPETAKTETAIGMICSLHSDGRQKNQAKLRKPDVYSGCGITVHKAEEKKILAAEDFVDTYNDQFFSSPKDLKVEFDKELPELEAFIAFFNRITAKTGNEMQPIDITAFSTKKKSLWNKIKQECENTLKEGRFEPPFILMLKVFLEEYAEDFLWKKLD